MCYRGWLHGGSCPPRIYGGWTVSNRYENLPGFRSGQDPGLTAVEQDRETGCSVDFNLGSDRKLFIFKYTISELAEARQI